MFHLRRSDAESQRSKSPVGSVAVAADNGKARLREAQFGADNVHDALTAAGEAKVGDIVDQSVALEGQALQARLRVGDEGRGTFKVGS